LGNIVSALRRDGVLSQLAVKMEMIILLFVLIGVRRGPLRSGLERTLTYLPRQSGSTQREEVKTINTLDQMMPMMWHGTGLILEEAQSLWVLNERMDMAYMT